MKTKNDCLSPVIGKMSFKGDEFPNDSAYLKQIPGCWDSLVKASNKPLGDGQVYDSETFWKED